MGHHEREQPPHRAVWAAGGGLVEGVLAGAQLGGTDPRRDRRRHRQLRAASLSDGLREQQLISDCQS